MNIKDIGRALGARYILSGSVRKEATRVRVAVQLTDTDVGTQLWAERYDRNIAYVFLVQDEITAAVTNAILPALDQAERERAMRKPPHSLGAWEAYQRGMWCMTRVTGADKEKAREFFQQAIKLDPSLARAYSGLAYTYNRDVVNNREAPETALRVAAPLARTAVVLDEADASAHAILSMILLFMLGDYDESEVEARRALEPSPRFSLAQSVMGMVLIYSGKPQTGISYAREGLRLDPRNPLVHDAFHIAQAEFFAGNCAGAVEAARMELRTRGDHPAMYFLLAASLGQLGKNAEASQALLKAEALKGAPFRISPSGKRLPGLRTED